MNASIIFLFIFIITIICFLLIRNNLLIALLTLELFVLTLVSITLLLIGFIASSNILTMLIILTLGACEARLGLACLIKISRSYGNDKLNNNSIVIC